MSDWLLTIDGWLRENRPAYYSRLRPGVDHYAIAAAEQALGIRLPEALAQLYMWKDGQPDDCYDSLFYNLMFPSLERSATTAAVMTEDRTEFEAPDWWLSSWFPFLDNGAGDLVCVDVEGAFGGRPGQVLSFWHETADRDIEYASVEAWGETFAASLKRGLWHETPEGTFRPSAASTRDDAVDAHDQLRAEMNPGYPWHALAGEGA